MAFLLKTKMLQASHILFSLCSLTTWFSPPELIQRMWVFTVHCLQNFPFIFVTFIYYQIKYGLFDLSPGDPLS